jgi:pimeloyl-ACP methyl ester carboxylesterase
MRNKTFASREEAISNKVLVVGHGLGGGMPLYAVENDTRVKGLVLWSTPANHAYNVKKFILLIGLGLSYYLSVLVSYLDSLVDISTLVYMKVFAYFLKTSLVRKNS